MMFLILIVIAVTNVENLITYPVTTVTINSRTNVTTSRTTCFMTTTVSLLCDSIALLMRIYLPFIIMLVFNVSIINKLIISKKNLSKHSNQGGESKLNPVQLKFTIATIIMDFIFWAFYALISISLTLNMINTIFGIFSDSVAVANNSLFANIAQLVAISYHSVMFFIYMAFNKYFRTEFFILIRVNKPQQQEINTQTQTKMNVITPIS